MKLSRTRVWLVVAAVLMGQWLNFAHAFQHQELAPVEKALCAYCVSGIGSAPPPDHGADFKLHVPGADAPPAAAVSRFSSVTRSQQRIRGPPSRLA